MEKMATTESNLGPELELFNRLCGLGTEEEQGYRTGPPAYVAWLLKSRLGS